MEEYEIKQIHEEDGTNHKEVEFADSIKSFQDAANGQVSDVKIQGLTTTNLIKNGNFEDGFNLWGYFRSKFEPFEINNNTIKWQKPIVEMMHFY